MAPLTQRLSCSAHHLRTVASCPCFSDSSVSFSTPQRTTVHPQDPLLYILESTLPPGALVLPWSSALEGRERARMCDFPTAGSKGCRGLCSAILEGPWGLEAPWCLQGGQGGPPPGRLSPLSVWIPPLAKAVGSAIYCLPPASRPHAHWPHLPKDKGLHCLQPLAWPLNLLPWPV